MRRKIIFLICMLLHIYMWGAQSVPPTITIDKTLAMGETITICPAEDAVKDYGGVFPHAYSETWWTDGIKNDQNIFTVTLNSFQYNWNQSVNGVNYTGTFTKIKYTLTAKKGGTHTFLTKISYSYPHRGNNGGTIDESGYIDITYNIRVPEVTSISLPTSISLFVGESQKLTPVISDSDASYSLSWSSDNQSVATVSSNGTVKAIKAGTANITCTANNGVKGTCRVIVSNQNVTNIILNTSEYTLDIGGSYQLSATVLPDNATNKTVSWSSSNISITTVSSSGLVTGKSAGTSTITCTANDGSGVKATCKVTVKNMLVSGITLNSSNCSLNIGETFQLTATITPSNATNKTVSWISNNTSIATVSSSGLVTAKSAGTTTITCAANDGSGVKATCKVTIQGESTPEPYAVLSNGNTKLTFYYDGKKASRNGMDVGPFSSMEDSGWYSQRENITTVVFNASFANYTTLTSTAYWFSGCSALTTISGITYLNTSNVKVMSDMFRECSNLTSLNVSHFNTANVIKMNRLFSGCSKLTSLDVSNFNTANVLNMTALFYGCSALTSLDVSHFDTSNAIHMEGMFSGCSKLTSLDVSNFNTANVKKMIEMFYGCSNLITIYCNDSWSCASSTNMFKGCISLVGAIPYNENKVDVNYANPTTGYFTMTEAETPEPYAALSNSNTKLTFYYDGKKASRNGMDVGPFSTIEDSGWYSQRENITTVVFDVSFANYTTLTSTAYWFSGCSALTTISGITYLNTSNVKDMSDMFKECSNLTSLDVSHFNTAKVIKMNRLFSGCSKLTSLDVSNFNTANVTSMTSLFYGCSALTSLDVNNFNTSKVTHMGSMFNGCSGITSLDVSHFDTSKATHIDNMFAGCSKLTSLDVSNFNTANVTTMTALFNGCSALTSLDVSNFNTANVTSMKSLFNGCSALTSLNVSHFDTSKAKYMDNMFSGCSKLTNLDVSCFSILNVTNMDKMFYSCSSLTTIYCNDSWSCASSTNMFKGCTSLKGAISYDSSKVDVNYANPTTGYFTMTEAGTKCATPTITNNNGTLTFACKTAGAVCHYEIARGGTGNSVTLPATSDYVVKVWATKAGCQDSDVATTTITMKQGDVNGDNKVTITDAVTVVNIILNGGASAPALSEPEEAGQVPE